MMHNIFNISLTPTEEGLILTITSVTNDEIHISGTFDKIYPIMDSIISAMDNTVDQEYIQ